MKQKIKILILSILIGIIIFGAINLISADIISINNYGSNEVVIVGEKAINGFFFGNEQIPPSISLISPEHGTQDTDGSVRFIFNVNDDSNIANCSLRYQEGIYLVKSDISKTSNIIEVLIDNQNPLYRDNLQWYISCYDQYGNMANSEIRNLDTKPDISSLDGTRTFEEKITKNKTDNKTIEIPIIKKKIKYFSILYIGLMIILLIACGVIFDKYYLKKKRDKSDF